MDIQHVECNTLNSLHHIFFKLPHFKLFNIERRIQHSHCKNMYNDFKIQFTQFQL